MTDPRIAVLSALSSPDWHPVPEAHGMPWGEAEELLAAYDASRAAAVPPAPADRAAVLREAADAIEEAQHRRDDIVNDALGFLDNNTEQQHIAVHRSARLLRRMASEAQQPETPLRAELKPWQLLGDAPDEPLPQTERLVGGRRLTRDVARQADTAGEQQ